MNLDKDKYMIMHANCISVRGAKQLSISDLQKSVLYVIPVEYFEVIQMFRSSTIAELQNRFGSAEVNSFLEFLISHSLAFIHECPDWFPELDLSYDFPGKISNMIIDADLISKSDLEVLSSQILEMKVGHIELRYFNSISYKQLIRSMKTLNVSSVYSMSVVAPYITSLWDCCVSKSLFTELPTLFTVFLHSASTEAYFTCKDEEGVDHVASCSSDTIQSHFFCGKVSSAIFFVNIPNFTESHHHNSCLNRKISIDVDGNIKNCPSMSQSFGNIKDTTLQEALDHPDFKKYWNVTKDQIAVCKDCEFRYICTDCRAYIENPEDMYSKPLKCGYNPYTCEWEEWSTNPLKQKAIDYYGMREVLPEFKMKPDYVPNTPSDAT